jgi:hypothetical protein
VEWVERGRLTRPQLHALIVEGFFSAVGGLRDAVSKAEPHQAEG